MSHPNILLVGHNSFLAQAFLAVTPLRDQIRTISHQAIPNVPLAGVDCVVNFAYTPQYFYEDYRSDADIDRLLSDKLAGQGIHFVMFSSRKVYAPNQNIPIEETSELDGQGVYGKNKIITESYIAERLVEKYTILRLSNVFGFEPGRHTFMGTAQQTLIDEGKIYLDIDEDAFRDFLPVEYFSTTLDWFLQNPTPGIFNMGSGVKTSVGDVARWLIHGYGRGDLHVDSQIDADSFVFNISKLARLAGVPCTNEKIKSSCIKLGKELQNA